MWGEGQLMDPGQDNVLSGLRHEHSEDCQNTRHPQLYCSYRCLRGGKIRLAQLAQIHYNHLMFRKMHCIVYIYIILFIFFNRTIYAHASIKIDFQEIHCVIQRILD